MRRPREVNRLDLQHYALREAMGADSSAPIAELVRATRPGGGSSWSGSART